MAKYSEIEMTGFTSCTQDPQSLLSKALQEKNMRDFRIALEMEADPTRLDENTNMTIFEKALQTPGYGDFVQECIKRGCRCDYVNRRLYKRPINFAADSRDPEILSKILEIRNLQVDVKYSNLTPLNSLAKNITPENADDVFSCMKKLIEYGANPNIPDQREMTPILNIINNKKLDNDIKKEIIQYLLENAQIDLDTSRNGEAREKIRSRYPDIRLPEEASNGPSHEMLVTLLRSGSEERFIKTFNEYQLNLSDRDNQHNITQENNLALLFEAIKKGLNNAVDIILKAGVNINPTQDGSTALEIACIWGNWKALQNLLDVDDMKMRNFENLLITCIQKLDEPIYEDFSDYNKCFHILLDSPKIDINGTDKSGSSPLHYAVKYKNEKAIKELLKRGAYIGTRSAFNDLPITEISPETLEEYFDSCITTNGLKPGDDNFEIRIDYKNLIPSKISRNKTKISQMSEEMLPIEHMADSKELRHLLKHPLITSFLFLKWHRLSIVFYINLLLYALFCTSLVTYIILHFHDSINSGAVVTFKTLTGIGLIYMISREVVQILIAPQSYFRSAINWLELALVFLTIVSLSEPNYEKETQRVLAVFTILLASIELCLLIGSLPVPSISTHMLMLRAVSTSFLKSFTLYSIFVITFSLCFYILFGKIDNSNEDTAGTTNSTNEPNGEEDGEFNKFVNPFIAIIKTIVMLTGEFDAGDINFHSVMSYLVFLLFVCFMSIVLFNLLNGLAVSDTQAIKAQAELNGCICRTNLLASYERMLMGKGGTTSFFVRNQPFKYLCTRLTNLFPNYICGHQIAILPNDENKILIPIKNTRELDPAPSKTNGTAFLQIHDDTDREKKLLNSPVRLLPCCCPCWAGRCAQMDVRTVKISLKIIERNQQIVKRKQKIVDDENRLRNIEDKIDKIFVLLENLSQRNFA